MHTQTEIEIPIRRQLPILFGKTGAVDDSRYLETKIEATEYASEVSCPFLRQETLRYQSILLYVSLILISISLLHVESVTVSGAVISIDESLLVVYSSFIALISAVLLLHSYVDIKRSQFTREKMPM